VLAHGATDGFLTQYVWNSVLKSLVYGMPMVAWPLYTEQRQNVVMLSDGVGATHRVPESKGRHKIAATVREVMQREGKGAVVRAKVVELQKATIEGLRDGGAAAAVLDEVMEGWTTTSGGEEDFCFTS
jgi:hydroquinone glucosyltransferase